MSRENSGQGFGGILRQNVSALAVAASLLVSAGVLTNQVSTLGVELARVRSELTKLSTMPERLRVLAQQVEKLETQLKTLSAVPARVDALEARNSLTDLRVDKWFRESWPEVRERIKSNETRLRVLEERMIRNAKP